MWSTMLVFLTVAPTLWSDQSATADDGSRVILRDDNSWVASGRPPGTMLGMWMRDFLTSSTAIPFLLSLLANVVGVLAFRNVRRGERRRFMDSLMSEYQSPQMHLALESMFAFRNRFTRTSAGGVDPCGGTGSKPAEVDELGMCKAYHRELKDARKTLQKLEGEKRAGYVRGMLHYQRRLVSHFLQRMDWLVRKRGLAAADIAAYWPSGSLKELTDLLGPLNVDPKESMERLVRTVADAEGRTGHKERWIRIGRRAAWLAGGIGLGFLGAVLVRVL